MQASRFSFEARSCGSWTNTGHRVDVFTSKALQNLSIAQFEDYAIRSPSISFMDPVTNGSTIALARIIVRCHNQTCHLVKYPSIESSEHAIHPSAISAGAATEL